MGHGGLARAYLVNSPENQTLTEDWVAPEPGPDQLQIRVLACGLNFADLLMIKGTYQETPPYPFVPGLEVCGEIIQIGSNVNAFTTGERIVAYCGAGGLAETATIDAARCIKMPANMPADVAAGFQIAYGTSHLALTRRARLGPDDTMLVLGAAGGVGLTAVEIGKALGARVIAVARGADKLDIARKAGADILIDALAPDLLDQFRALAPINVVYDAVGGDTGAAGLRALAPEGRFLVIGFASGTVPEPKLNHVLVKNIDIIGFYWGAYLRFNPAPLRDSMQSLLTLYDQGKIAPHVSHVLPLSQVEDGLDLLRTRTSTGKVVITP
jgi:NADPH2:quinone reductase